jgi:ankyrin repeat protein
MTYTGVHNLDKYILPQYLNIQNAIFVMRTNKYSQNIIHHCKKIMISHTNNNLLIAACAQNNHHIIKLLIKSGEYINQVDNNGNNSLYHALINKKYNHAKILIDSGIDINTKDNLDNYLLNIICLLNISHKYAKLLLSTKSCYIHHLNQCLLTASSMGKYKFVKELLKNGADINYTDNQNESSINKALKNKNEHIIKLLIRTNYNQNIEYILENQKPIF